MDKVNLFVPGRLCLFGEHSDWAGLNRTINSEIYPGHAIVTGIEQGIYAEATKDKKFVVECSITGSEEYFECEMDTDKLREVARTGLYYSYVAGVASYVNEHYNVQGLRINITKRDLPMKSGLSSSAAICVLVARAFNRIYNLNLNIMGEMNIAFMGEQRTPSRCGRLDQACAFGVRPVLMTFDGNEISAKRLKFKKTLYYVFADLKSHKDTVKILASLNRSYPFAANENDRRLHDALGKENHENIKQAVSCMESGDVEALGMLMNKAQENFDEKIAPMCPEELTAPLLHKTLADTEIRKYVYGGKGVGSQGDGSIQFLAKDEECQQKLIDYLNNTLHMEAFPLTLKPKQAVTRAIIPVAGLGTRLFPATKAIKKGLMPIVDSDGMLKPLILVIIEQLVNSGITEICLVIGEEDRACYDALFLPMSAENKNRLPEEKRKYEEHIVKIGKNITYVYQKELRGFGHAVYQCREFTKDEPVLLLLGDMVYQSDMAANCTTQMIDAYEKTGLPIISMQKVPLKDVVNYGIMHGQWDNEEETLLKLDAICEKPTEDYAEDNLNNSRKNHKNNFYAVFGQYILTKEIFESLEYEIENNMTEHGELQLTTAIERTRQRIGAMGLLVNGISYDTGIPEKYRQTFAEFGSYRQERK